MSNSLNSKDTFFSKHPNLKLKVKICGITNKNDLKVVETYGANLLGFINVGRSPRYVSLDEANELLNSLNNRDKAVLVLEEKNVDKILNKIKKTGIKNVQVHSLTSSKIKILKEKIDSENLQKGENDKIRLMGVIGLSEEIFDEKKSEIESFAMHCDAILLDYQIKGKSGGTGKQIPLDVALNANKIIRNKNKDIWVFLAGGLDVKLLKNQGKIIREYFDGVDFNSTLEDSPGIKNELKIKETINQIKKI
ncbi:phosphoribosylanthranilate isomerase [Methanobacterium alcaliphilum]|uniref:phosphoribosylanthranilate isomerase n=1 Tax=Methanobacterium alcaliphilum TaxID=392018 RepID=UPI00200ADDE6|nr:phosphoribosylanthranilate isomerase [Methanobacterium alcaliphilum]MCK9152598.1 phosphoribosylanthranilate isomerase [Methanobacterium alcaliphilum]